MGAIMVRSERGFYDDLHAIYDLINPARDDEYTYYRDIITESDEILEVGSGSGTLTLTLAECARSVVGIDISPNMLDIARPRVPTVQFYNADMRDFQINRKFDKVICPFNTFMHMHSDDDAIAALSRFREHCHPEGRVVIDMFDVDLKYFPAQTIDLLLADCIDPVSSRHIQVFESSQLDRAAGALEVTVHINDAKTQIEVARSSYGMRLYRPGHVNSLLLQAGLTPLMVETSYKRNDVQHGFRQIHFAQPTAN
jgi:dTDP-3-amino-3,6-dideoxy-alpha-D-glucopyranose N,N-dimethyltransferase/dTDP-3-amino-3,4,6-trideoxy-alpha-D-glucopyranose N,N-dimethyltransferase